jgi:hypothetical protein
MCPLTRFKFKDTAQHSTDDMRPNTFNTLTRKATSGTHTAPPSCPQSKVQQDRNNSTVFYSIPSPEKHRQARIQLLLHDHRVKNSKIEITVPSFNSIPSPEKHHQARIQLLLCVHRVKNSKLKKQHPLLFQYPHQRSTVRHAYSSSFMSTE